MPDIEQVALAHLQALTADSQAHFRDGQLEAIRALVEARSRVLVVQRTGWGKSAVYFIATRMLRDLGLGPTLLVSPLIALMDNQVEAAQRMGLRATVVNSTNRDAWDTIRAQLDRDEIDLVLVSEQRLGNPEFRQDWLPSIGGRVGLVVVDEVHCISDWGHDFRPHYRRIGRFLQGLPVEVPVIGCTATANDRVIADVERQLGDDILTIRGALGRDGLRLEVHTDKRRPDARLAWLARNVGDLPGTGIVYCLTRRDVDVVADFLGGHGIACGTYVGGGSAAEVESKNHALEQFHANEVKCMVATSALGMGYDKPDVGFVIHYQMPQSAIAYYQQVGRAGRALPESYGILLAGTEDRDIQDWFISQAFPDHEEIDAIFAAFDPDSTGASDQVVRLAQLAARVNIGTGRLGNLMVQLEVEGVVEKAGSGWVRTEVPWTYPHERVEQVNAWRREEQAAKEAYQTIDDCRMRYLRRQLDDPAPDVCGVCDNCRGSRFGVDPDIVVLSAADDRLRRDPVDIAPRLQWPAGLDQVSGRIATDERAEPGWALTSWGPAGWGPLVRSGHEGDGYDPELVRALAALCMSRMTSRPEWLAYVPSTRRPRHVAELARALGLVLDLPVTDAVRQVRSPAPQAEMRNSVSQVRNLWGAFDVVDAPTGPCLLVDDLIDSRWTITVIARLLRRAGCDAVVPIGLAATAS